MAEQSLFEKEYGLSAGEEAKMFMGTAPKVTAPAPTQTPSLDSLRIENVSKPATDPSVYNYGGTSSSRNRVTAPATGGSPIVGTPTATITPQVSQAPIQQVQAPQIPQGVQAPQAPVQPSNLLSLRDVAGGNIGFDAVTGNVTLGGNAYTPQQLQGAGLQNVDGRWSGTNDQIAGLLGLSQLRSGMEGAESKVQYQNGNVYVNGSVVDPATYGLVNIGGRNYLSPEGLQRLESEMGTQSPLGQNYLLNQQLEGQQDQFQQYQEENPYQMQIQDLLGQIREFKTGYEDDIKNLIQQTLMPFNYNPNQDLMLQKAIQYADKSMMEEMNKRGILNSSITADKAAGIREELLPKYQQLALQQYNEQIDKKFKTAEFLNKLNEQDLKRFTDYASSTISYLEKADDKTVKSFEKVIDSITEQIKNNEVQRKNNLDQKNKTLTYALDRLGKLGYVDKEVSLILGVPIGTPSYDAMKLALERQDKYDLEAIRSSNSLKEIDYRAKKEIEKLYTQASIKQEEEKRDPSFKKSPYFETVREGVKNTIEKYNKDPKVAVPEMKLSENGSEWQPTGKTLTNYAFVPGSVEHKELVTQVMSDPTLNEYEKYRILEDNKIPYTVDMLKQYGL